MQLYSEPAHLIRLLPLTINGELDIFSSIERVGLFRVSGSDL